MKNETGKAGGARYFEISLMNVFLCLLVIFIHVSSAALSAMEKNSWQYAVVLVPWRLAAFVVPGFIFLSGMKLFINSKKEFSYSDFLRKRLSAVVLPYILWVLVYYLYFCSRNYFPFQIADLLKYIFVGDLVAHFYFVIIIVQFYLLAPFWIWIFRKVDGRLIILLSFNVMFILGQRIPDIISFFKPGYNFAYNDRLFTTYILYWAAGCYAGMNYEKFKELLRRKGMALMLTVLFTVTAVLGAYYSWLNFSGRREILWLENFHIFYCVVAIPFWFMVSAAFEKMISYNFQTKVSGRIFFGEKPSGAKKFLVRFVNAVDKASYLIYLSHCLVIFVMDGLLSRADFGLPLWGSYLLRLCIVYSVTIVGCLFWKSKVREANKARTRKNC